MKISEAADLWIKRCRRDDLERATLRSYTGHVDKHINPRIGERMVTEMTAPDVQDFLDDMLDDGVSRAMLKKVLASLRAIISHAQSRGVVDRNVARDVKLRNSRRHEEERAIPSKDEIRLLIDQASERHRAFILTALFTGLRASEMRGLCWKHVDFAKGVIQVRQRADRFNQMGSPKSKTSRRDIPMAPLLKTTLMAWKLTCPKGELGLVFPNGAGNIESHSNLSQRVFGKLQVECGMTNSDGKPKYGLHCLRHAAASLFIDQGWSPKKVQSFLGHSTINMTFDVYGHLFQDTEQDLELMAKMESDLLAA